MKSGWKTSEFWLIAIGIVLLIVFAWMNFHWLAQIAPLAAGGLYSLGRGIAKQGSGSRPFVYSERSLSACCPEKHAATRQAPYKFTDGARGSAGR